MRVSLIGRLRWVVASSVLVGALLPVSVSAASAVIVVDDDGLASKASCDADRTARVSIQSAIADASTGTTVLVCPGSYAESLAIGPGKVGLTLRSTSPLAAHLRPPGSEAPAIAIRGTRGVTVEGFDIRARGEVVTPTDLTVRPAAPIPGEPFCTPANAAISLEAGAIATIIGNRIDRDHECGYFWGVLVRGSEATVVANTIRDFWIGGVSFLPSPGETLRPRGVVAGNKIRYAFRGFDEAAAIPGDAPTFGGDAIVVIGAPQIEVLANDIRAHARNVAEGVDHLSFAILVDQMGGSGSAKVRGNTVDGIMTNGIVVGFPGDRNDDTAVAGNSIRGAKLFGLLLLGLRGSVVRDNVVTEGGAGVLATESRNNEFLDNDFRGNAELDCEDDSTGDRTSGTANKWRGNLGDDSSPVGICD